METPVDQFTPVSVTPIHEGASMFTSVRRVITNPAELWTSRMFREFVYDTNFLGLRIIDVRDPHIVQEVLTTHQAIFPKSEFEQMILERATGIGLLAADGPQWKAQRRATSPVFRYDRMRELIPAMIDAGEQAGLGLSAQSGEVDVMPFLTTATIQIIGNTLLSGEDGTLDFEGFTTDVEILIEQIGKIDLLDIFGPTRKLPKPWAWKARAAIGRLQKDAMSIVELRRMSRKSDNDLLAFMLSAKDPDTGLALSDVELRDNIVTFIATGFETTSLALTWALYLLANSEEWQEILVKEISEVCGAGPLEPVHLDSLRNHELVLKEAMRLYPPVPAMHRVAKEDVAIGDLQFKKGNMVVLALYPMHRHEKLWDNPASFDPTRFEPGRSSEYHRFQYIPFSGGPRICIGMKFAMMEAVAVLASIVRKVRLAPAKDFVPYPRSRVTLRPVGGMILRVQAR